jgi:hypothetical protein
MTARVVDLLESVEVEIQHGVFPLELRGAHERAGKPLLEFAPIDEPGELSCRALMRELDGFSAALA